MDVSTLTPKERARVREMLPTESRCVATSHTSGERCRQVPELGANVCRFHGGKAPQTIAKAEERIMTALEKMGHLRDLALDRLIEDMAPGTGNMMDPRTRAQLVSALTKDMQLLQGLATSRQENVELQERRAIIEVLNGEFNQLAERDAAAHDMIAKLEAADERPERTHSDAELLRGST